MKKAVVGIVEAKPLADAIVSELSRIGFANDQVSVLLPDKAGRGDFIHERSTKAPEGAVIGGAALGGLGGVLGLIAGIGAVAIPGLGPFIAAGPLLSILSGAGAGAAIGGIVGALVGMGIPELEAKVYEGKLVGGNILIAVHTDSVEEAKRARQVIARGGAHDVSQVVEERLPHPHPLGP
jgi:hypothetical protein